jgi:hypothetical protein
VTGSFLALTLLCPIAPPPAQPGAEAGLQKGDELTFTGTVEEAVDRTGMRFRRSQRLEIRVLVLEKTETWTDAAVLTLLRRKDDAVTGAVGTITGGAPEKAVPPAARLDLVRIHSDGSVHRLLPAGPLALDARTPAGVLPALPLDTFAPFEFGMFPPRPPRSAPDKPWAVASTDPNRPAETWQVQGTDIVNGERCTRLVVNQQHPNWVKPVGGQSAWYRADAVWVSALDGTARKVHRVIKHRDGLASELAAWVEVKYELKDQTPVLRRTFDRYRRDVEIAFATGAEIAPLLSDPVKHGAKFFETRLKMIDRYLNESDTSSPYREAVQAVRRQLDAAQRGEAIAKPAPGAPLGLAPVTPKRPAWPEPGHLAPDFTAGAFRLAEARGKPVVLVFFKPGSETTDLALAVADALHTKYGTRAAIVPLAVWGDATAAVRDRDRRKLTVPIYDGTQADTAYGVESVPRFVVIDAAGTVKWTFSGVGAETGYSAREQLERVLAPAAPNAAVGTTLTSGPGTGGAGPRP